MSDAAIETKFLANATPVIGRERADRWLSAHYGQLGKETTVDMQEKYL